MNIPRWPALVILLGALVGLVILDRRDPDVELSTLSIEGVAAMPVAAGDGALGSTWYCAGGTAADDGFADHVVMISNPSDDTVTGTLTAYPTDVDAELVVESQRPVTLPLDVPPRSQQLVRLGDVVTAAWAAALLEFGSAEVIVDHRISGPAGTDSAACSSFASDSWFFPAGSTSKDAREVLVVFNPFPDDAVVDVTFATDEGGRAPQRFDGLPVPAGSAIPLDITDVVARWNQLSATVRTRTGRVVTDRIVSYDGTEGLTGLTLSAGAPQPALTWIFPAGHGEVGVTESYVILNPHPDRSAEVDLEVRLDSPELNGAIEPFELTVPPAQRIVVVVNPTEVHPVSSNATVDTSGRIPADVGHSVTVRSFNGLPVVVEQVLTASDAAPPSDGTEGETDGAEVAPPTGGTEGDGDETAENAGETDAQIVTVQRGGVTSTLGAPVGATQLVVAGSAPGDTVVELAIVNPSLSTIARVSVSVVVDGVAVPVDRFTDIEIGSLRRLEVVGLAEVVGDEPFMIVIDSSTAVIAQRTLRPAGASGVDSQIATPVGGTLSTVDFFGG